MPDTLTTAPTPARSLAARYALLAALTALPFLPSLKYQFVYDDDVQIVNNASIRTWDSVPDFFTSTSFGTFDPTAASNLHYRPIFYLWLRVNDALFGLHPFGWHFAALCIHLAVTLLLFRLLLWHFKDEWIAFASALLFGVYPIHIESVVWVSGATDPIAALFLLASILLWLKHREASPAPSQPGLLIGSLACFAGALLTKETAIVFPAIIFVYALVPRKSVTGENPEQGPAFAHRFLRATREIIPFAIVAALYLAARFAIVRHIPASPHWLSTYDALLTTPIAMLFYLRHLVWPFHLSLFYSLAPVTSPLNARYWLPKLILLAVAIGIYFWWRRTRSSTTPGALAESSSIPAALAWLFLPLFPILDLALLQQDDLLHDRYLYLPSIGLVIAFGVVLTQLLRSASASRASLIKAIAIVLIVVFGVATLAQAAPWRENFSLYQQAVDVSPDNTIARNNLAGEFAKRDQLDQAASMFQAVLRDRPDYWLASYNLGYVNYRLKHFDAAEQSLQRAIALNPADADQHAYLGLTYFHENRFADSAAELRKAIAIKPAGTGYHIALALVLLQMQDLDGARAECLDELAYHPENAVAQSELALIEQRIAKAK